jgi:methylase of polypeptide subunit release factors
MKRAGVDEDLLRIADGLESADGVFEPKASSFALAASVRGRSGSFLDLGTGTGFLSIVISLSADAVLATDCSPAAVQCAKRNFRRFGVQAEVRRSDMFEHVSERFDYIVFNPPVHRGESEFDRRFKNRLKRILPTSLSTLLSVVARPIFKYSLRSVVADFYLEASRHLNPGGSMIVNTLSPDTRWLSDLIAGRARLTERRRASEYCIVEIAPLVGDTLKSQGGSTSGRTAVGLAHHDSSSSAGTEV